MRDTFRPHPVACHPSRARVAGRSSSHTLSWVNASLLQRRVQAQPSCHVPHCGAALALYQVTLVDKHDTSALSH